MYNIHRFPINKVVIEMKKIIAYTDGACSSNPGIGGYSAIMNYKGAIKELSGSEENTTNNRMELTSVIKALESLNQKCAVELYSDSKYIIDAVQNGWLETWKNNGWKKTTGDAVQNIDLWDKLYALLQKHRVNFHWVKGHDGDEFNEKCDKLATEAIRKLKEKVAHRNIVYTPAG